jgi:sugar O-acyltransferase (sialic acid O-acetyltransferase NeuD family)
MAVAGVLIFGAGGFGQAVADTLSLADYRSVAGFVDDRTDRQTTVLGYRMLDRVADLAARRALHETLVVAIVDNARRRGLSEQALELGFQLAAVVHPRAWVRPRAHIGSGALVMAGATVGTAAQVGVGALANAAAVVDHHAQLGDFAELGVYACMAGGVQLGCGAWPPEGCVLRAGSAVSAGTIVSRSPP